jgi:superfamily II DNA/RNA helicase
VTKTFRELGVHPALCDALESQGIVHPFPIQELTLPLALDGNDLIGQARTGTGKTLAFGLPLLQQLDPSSDVTQALVVVPTRELCVQVHADLAIGEALGLTTISVYGGTPYEAQIEALTSGVHVVVGTPGRLIDHLNRGNLDLSHVKVLVLDEADEMLDMGFLPDVERLIQATPSDERHTMLFSATMPTAIVKMARRYLTHPTFTRADAEEHETAPNVAQHFFSVHRMDKPRLLARILQSRDRGGVYVFVRTKHMADRLVNELEELRIPAIPIHGDLRQTAREKNLDRFREGKATVLVATEVAARGLDVTGVTHVVNYDCPEDHKMYLHRIGRTARAGEAGVAVTFAEFNEVDRLNVIRKAVGATDAEIVPVFSTSDLLTDLFDLPAEKPWDHLSRTKKGSAEGRGGSRGRDGDRASRDRAGQDERGRGATARDGSNARRAGEDDRGGRRDGGGRTPRKGRSDGKPKSTRSSEGAGSDRDARRERGRAAGPDDGAPASGTDDRSPTAEPSRAAESAPSDEAATRTRTRTRTRARTGDAPRAERRDEAPERDRADGDRQEDRTGGQRTRARGGRDRGRAGAEGDQDPRQTGGPTGSTGTGGQRARERSGGRARGEGTRDEESGQRGSSERGRTERNRSESGRTERSRSESGRTERSRSERSRSERSRSERGGRGGGTRDAGGTPKGGGRGGRSGGRTGDEGEAAPVRTEPRGKPARGDGEPQLARRVKVEHLP